MLEQQAMLVQPWTCPGETPGRVRGGAQDCVLADPATSRPLGYARWRFSAGRAWQGWLARPRLEVCESGDEPLLFTVRHPWSLIRRWEVRDADDRGIGVIRGPWLIDGAGQLLAVRKRGAGTDRSCYQDHAGELALELRYAEGTHVTFATRVRDLPFTKMMVLAAVLLEVSGSPP
jgi:hypothetical protein